MKLYEFPNVLEKALGNSPDSDIERWLRSFKNLQREMDMKFLYLAQYFEAIPESLRKEYVETLVSVLESVPTKVRISTSTALSEQLNSLEKVLSDEGARRKLRSALERNLEARQSVAP